MAAGLKVRVLVRPKAGILDPQGEAVRSALPALGFEGIRTVHVGRLIEMEVESSDERGVKRGRLTPRDGQGGGVGFSDRTALCRSPS